MQIFAASVVTHRFRGSRFRRRLSTLVLLVLEALNAASRRVSHKPPGEAHILAGATRAGDAARMHGRVRLTPVPILMFHMIAHAPPDARWPGLYVRPDVFRAQLRELAARGYSAVTTDQVFDHWLSGRPLPFRPMVISFDDGHRSVHSEALPALAALGWPAVLNLHLERLTWTDGVRPVMVRELAGAGWEIQSHTLTHPDLTELGRRKLTEEVGLSRRFVRTLFGVDADFFCYPSGRHDERVVAAVRSAGYRGATTTRPGLARPSEPFRLRRVRVDAADGPSTVARRLDKLVSHPTGASHGPPGGD